MIVVFFLVCWQTFHVFYHLLCHQYEHVWSYSDLWLPVKAEIWWRNEGLGEKELQEFIMSAVFFFFFLFVTLWLTRPSVVTVKWVFRWQVAWMHIENRCNSITQILLASEKSSKIKNTAPSTKQSEDCIYTHTNPWKKGYCSFFPFYFL